MPDIGLFKAAPKTVSRAFSLLLSTSEALRQAITS
jgi:hypothetical protein